MNQQKKTLFIYIIIILSISIMIYIVAATDLFQKAKPDNQHILEEIHLIITSPTWNLTYTSLNTSNTTVASLLFECATTHQFPVLKEYYPGYDSYFITGINNILNGENNSYWQFYVNDIYSTMGCSSYQLTSNDVVTWRFESSPW